MDRRDMSVRRVRRRGDDKITNASSVLAKVFQKRTLEGVFAEPAWRMLIRRDPKKRVGQKIILFTVSGIFKNESAYTVDCRKMGETPGRDFR